MTPGRRWVTLIDASVAMVSHQLLSSVMRSSDDSDWPVHFLIYVVIPWFMQSSSATTTIVPCSMVVRQRVMSGDMAEPWQLATLDNKDSWHPVRTVTCCQIYIRVFFVLGMTRQASSCSIWCQRLGSASWITTVHSVDDNSFLFITRTFADFLNNHIFGFNWSVHLNNSVNQLATNRK